jgi:hypothetical protein
VLVFAAGVLAVAALDEELVAPLLPDVEDDEDEPDDALEEPPVVAVGVTGWKKLLPAPNPTLAA